MKEIFEADTDPMKEVLRSRATFAPTPTQQIMLSNKGQGGTMKNIIEAVIDPMKEVLCLGAIFAPTPTEQNMSSNLGQGGRL